MEGSLADHASIRGEFNLKNKGRLNKFGLAGRYGMQHLVARKTIALVLLAFFAASSNAMRKFDIIRKNVNKK